MKKVFRIENLDCANCAAKLERQLNKLDGVNVKVNFLTQKLTVETEREFAEIFEKIVALAKKVEPKCVIQG